MKELRFEAADGLWRVAFAFDRKRMAIGLLGIWILRLRRTPCTRVIHEATRSPF